MGNDTVLDGSLIALPTGIFIIIIGISILTLFCVFMAGYCMGKGE